MTKTKKKNTKIIKHTGASAALIAVFIAAVVLLNVTVSMIFERYPLTIDLTDEHKYSVSQQTADYIKSIDDEITITVLAPEEEFSGMSEYTLQAAQLLKRYQQYAPNINVTYSDLLSHPEIASKYTSIDLKDFDIIVETKGSFQRVKVLTICGDLVSWNAEMTSSLSQYSMTVDDLAEVYGIQNTLEWYSEYIVGSNAEAAFTSAIMSLTDPDPVSVTFLTGHREVSQFAYFKKLLSANGYQVSEVNIMTQDIPGDTDLLVIPAPSQDYLSEEMQKISDFLENDRSGEKNILYIASLQQGDTPDLDQLLASYGIKVEKAVIFENDLDRFYGGDRSYTIPTIASDSYMQDINASSPLLLMPMARPITLLFEESGTGSAEAYIQSSSQGSAYSYSALGFDQDSAQTGLQTSLAIASKGASSSDDATELMVIGSDEFLSDRWLQEASFQNSEYIISLLNGMTGKTSSGIVIATKTILDSTFDITHKQASILKWTFQLVIPLGVLLIGFAVYKKRKNR